MEDKIIEAIKYVRNKEKQRVTKERIFNFIIKTNTSIDQGHLIETFESMKANGVIFNKPKAKPESYFVTNRNSNSWIISDKSPTKINTVTSPKMKSPSTPDELSIIDNSMLTRKKQQRNKTPTPVTPKSFTYKANEVSKKHLFSNDLFLQEEIMFLRKNETINKITETLLQQISTFTTTCIHNCPPSDKFGSTQ